MQKSNIYSQIALQSGLENIFTFSDVIPYCFESAFMETLRIPESKDSIIPYFENELAPLIVNENILATKSKGIFKILLTDLKYSPINVFNLTDMNNNINFRFVQLPELMSISNNPNLFPSDNEGYWNKSNNTINCLFEEGISPTIQITYLKIPDITLWTNAYDFIIAGYGNSFIDAVIDLAISKLIDIAKRRG